MNLNFKLINIEIYDLYQKWILSKIKFLKIRSTLTQTEIGMQIGWIKYPKDTTKWRLCKRNREKERFMKFFVKKKNCKRKEKNGRKSNKLNWLEIWLNQIQVSYKMLFIARAYPN